MRLVLWNVRSLRDDARAVAGVLADLDPDLVLVTEAPRFRVSWQLPVRTVSWRTGLRAVPPGRPDCGLLALVRPGLAVVGVSRRRLSPEPGAHQRAGLGLTVDAGEGPLSVLLTHLDLVPAARERHAGELLAGWPEVDVISGDLNEGPSGPAWQALAVRRTAVPTGPTFPAEAPRRRIDAVLVGPRWSATPVPVDDPRLARATDHLPVTVDLAPS